MKKIIHYKNYKTSKIVYKKSKTSYKFTSALISIKYCYRYTAIVPHTISSACLV